MSLMAWYGVRKQMKENAKLQVEQKHKEQMEEQRIENQRESEEYEKKHAEYKMKLAVKEKELSVNRKLKLVAMMAEIEITKGLYDNDVIGFGECMQSIMMIIRKYDS